MIKIICFFCIFFHMITTVGITPYWQLAKENAIAVIKEVKDFSKPGALDKIIDAWEDLKILDPDTASKLSSYIDRLKSLLQIEPTQPVVSEQKTAEPPLPPQPEQIKFTVTPTVKQEIVKRLDQTAEAIKQAVSTSSKTVQETAELLCQRLPAIDLKTAGESTIQKATEIQTACANLGKKISASATEAKEAVAKQTAVMAEEINKELKKGKEKAEVKVQELCESVKQAASTFKEKAEDQWDKIKNSCSSFLTSEKPTEPKVSTQLEGQPIKAHSTSVQPETTTPFIAPPKTIKIEEKSSSPVAPKPTTQPNTNPFFTPEDQTKAVELKAKDKDTFNPFVENNTQPKVLFPTSSKNPFATSIVQQTPVTRTPQEKSTAVKKIPAQPKKAQEKIKEGNLLILSKQLSDFLTAMDALNFLTIKIDANNFTYFINKTHSASVNSMFTLYKKLSYNEQLQVKNMFTFAITGYMNIVLKQINYIVPLVNDSLENRINYLVLWLDIDANLACAVSKQEEKAESISFNAFDGWKKAFSTVVQEAGKSAASLKKQATAAVEAIVCTDDELLFTQKDKEWEAVTTKTHVEKMIEEYRSSSIDMIQEGIAEPIFRIMNTDLKDLMPTDLLYAIKKACAPLMNVTESTVNFDKDIKIPKEQFFENNGNLTTLYNLWIRYLNKYIVKKGTSKWTDEQKKAFKQFNADYFIPLHETMKKLQSISNQEKIVKKMITEVDDYIKSKDQE